ncbi:branched-chain amino acid transport system substrate-binding protein [Enhydrobacter aerosaccus]|uniref:Branched-chain amino acid transport system substrate-binding protein n=1 Tax=Enhydrobacter aerosaccus TaxID=225324 RepID=A0A1T4SI14_9HYPH|nr:amino acid ABC transporter substrate-binding protein [Enhydrobacter aerosaccus]SKA27827.1 branched-chain amino acid transport system substrate-binding protein [Enhydrobacter aerosaccus]
MTQQLIGRRTALAGIVGTAAIGTRTAWAADPIKIGFSIPQTGGLAAIGLQALLTLQIWSEDVNARGGILGRPVQLVTYDDQSNPANVPRIYTKLLEVDKVDLIVTNGTNLTVPAMPIAMQRGMVVFCMLSLAVNDKFKYPRFFQTMPYGPHGKASISEGFFDVAMGMSPKPATVALVGADAEFSKNAVDGARDQARKRGLKIVYDRTYPPSTVDFGPVIRGIASANPDIVYIGSYPVDTSGMVRAARELGFRPKLFGGGMVGTQAATLKGDLGEMLNDVVSYELYCPAVADKFPDVEPLLKKYQPRAKEKGIDPQGYYVPPFAYATMEVLQQAVTAAGGLDQDKIAKAAHATTFKTIVGDIKFGADGEWDHPRMLWVQFRGLKGQGMDQFVNPSAEVVLDPPEYRTGELRYPMGVAKQ